MTLLAARRETLSCDRCEYSPCVQVVERILSAAHGKTQERKRSKNKNANDLLRESAPKVF